MYTSVVVGLIVTAKLNVSLVVKECLFSISPRLCVAVVGGAVLCIDSNTAIAMGWSCGNKNGIGSYGICFKPEPCY